MPPPADRRGFAQQVTALATDIDELGHVGNIVYVRWIQDIATAHWRALARPQDIARFVWVVSRHEIDYRYATVAGEMLAVETWLGAPHGARFDRYVDIRGPGGELRVHAKTVWAMVDMTTMRALRIPTEVAAPFLA